MDEKIDEMLIEKIHNKIEKRRKKIMNKSKDDKIVRKIYIQIDRLIGKKKTRTKIVHENVS